MSRVLLIVSVWVALVLFASPKSAFSTSLLAHGRYIVERVAMCEDCHTPRDQRGRFMQNKRLQGATLDFAPIHPIPGWKSKSERIAGLPKGWSKSDMVHFLETGRTPKGHLPHPPMPSYHMSHRDALAVTLYLMKLSTSHP